MNEKAKPIGSPVVTWEESVKEIMRIIQAEESASKLEFMRAALSGLEAMARGRREALRSIAGRPVYGGAE